VDWIAYYGRAVCHMGLGGIRVVMKSNENRISALVQKITLILVFLISTRTPIDADLWWHLRAGQVMWEQKTILLFDVFSYTRLNAPWVNAFWMSEIMFYLIYKLGEYFALTIFVSLMAALTFHIIQRRLPGNPFLNAFVVLLAVITAAPVWGPRPQIISFLFIALLDHWLSSKQNKWFIVVLFILWANIHGGWIWGFLFLAAHLAGLWVQLLFMQKEERNNISREIKDLLIPILVSIFAIGLNPNGLAIWKLPFEQVNVSMQIQEWLSPDFHRVDFHPFLWMIFLLLLISPFQPKTPNWSQMFKVLGFAYLTFVAQRNIALFAIVTLPLLAEWFNAALQLLRSKETVNKPSLKFAGLFNNLIIFILSATALGYAFLVSRPAEIDKHYPVDAVRWIQANSPAGRLFNSYNWGGYILWHLPEYPVFIDGRADLYGGELISQWQNVATAQADALSILNKWDVGLVFIESNTPIVELLKQNGWEIVFQDEMSVILRRE
jgi:hypothetical protein